MPSINLPPIDALVHLHRLALSGAAAPAYVRERTVRLSELEAEYREKRDAG
jgi:hypothetical protein